MQTVKIKCSICKMNYLTKFPSNIMHEDMDKLEKNYACDNCIKEGRSQRDAIK